MKTVTAFFVRLRTLFAKDIKRYQPELLETNAELHAKLWAPLEPIYAFLADVTHNAEENLYLDKPIEGSFPLFDVLKLTMDLFGGITYTMNKAKSFEPINFLTKPAHKPHLLSSKSLFMFLINSLKSSWTNVRHNAFELLSKYSDAFPQFHDSAFVNGILVPTALDFLKDPRAMMAEASALMLKLAFIKCTDVIDLALFPVSAAEVGEQEDAVTASPEGKRLSMLRLVLFMIKQRLQTFKTSLISEGKTSALMHGLLAFFKHVFTDYKVGDRESLGHEKFLVWRAFFKDVLTTSLEISKVCANLLSNNRITDDGEDAAVDCRGHPIAQTQQI